MLGDRVGLSVRESPDAGAAMGPGVGNGAGRGDGRWKPGAGDARPAKDDAERDDHDRRTIAAAGKRDQTGRRRIGGLSPAPDVHRSQPYGAKALQTILLQLCSLDSHAAIGQNDSGLWSRRSCSTPRTSR